AGGVHAAATGVEVGECLLITGGRSRRDRRFADVSDLQDADQVLDEFLGRKLLLDIQAVRPGLVAVGRIVPGPVETRKRAELPEAVGRVGAEDGERTGNAGSAGDVGSLELEAGGNF